MNLLKELKAWMKKNAWTNVKLSKYLGYSTKSTISHWFERGQVPRHREQDIRFLMKKGRR